MDPTKISVVSYNCHGFNQGSHYLTDLLCKNDIICIQEHWLGSVDSSKLTELNKDFSVFASYPVDSKLNCGILRGRPYGGVAVFVRADLVKKIKVVCNSDRLIVIQVNNFLICNVYMPCEDSDLFSYILGSICDYIAHRDATAEHYIVLGDFNCNYTNTNLLCDIFRSFVASCKLLNALCSNGNDNVVTYRHATLNSNSTIDYIFVSDTLGKHILSAQVVDSGVNFSDHIPVIVTLSGCVFDGKRGMAGGMKSCSIQRDKMLRWDKADMSIYYERSGVYLMPIFDELCKINELPILGNYSSLINGIYGKIINALFCSDKVIPRANTTFYKYWWNDELETLKNKSIDQFKLWTEAGKPVTGFTYQEMMDAKIEYKRAINEYREMDAHKVGEELYDSLLSKDMNSFWKSWKGKFGIKNRQAKMVEGCNDDAKIAKIFKDFFSVTCVPNNDAAHEEHRQEFLQNFKDYSVFEDHQNLFTVENVETALRKLKRGKAAGADSITTEHLIYAHPCLIVSLKMLFNLILKYGCVPEDFGKGILIPLLKDSSGDASLCDSYRGITLGSTISKLFEYVILGKYGAHLTTDSLQFGFQKGVGCSDALFTLKSVVNHFIKNGCTISMSALDIFEAFDRLSQYALLSKLMERKLPKQVISVLLSWNRYNLIKVKWNDCYSDYFHPRAGVRQGGVLSPFLFAIYIEDVLKQLKKQGKGCKVGQVYLGCFLYADDILLISQSVSCMQSMLNICSDAANKLDLKFNVKKSACMRIGKRYNVKCSKFLLQGIEVPVVDEIKYLGILIKKGTTFNRSYCSHKIIFFRCFNSIYSKAYLADEDVLVNLFKSFCLPIIMYACEAVCPSNADVKSMNKLINCAFGKIFHSYENETIEMARSCFSLNNIKDIIVIRQNVFMTRYYRKDFSFSKTIFDINYGKYCE